MSRLLKFSPKGLILIVLLSLALGGCFVLSEDITPPPGNVQNTAEPATQAPRPSSTPSVIQPTAEIETLPLGEGMVSVEIIDQTGGQLLEGDLEILLEGYDQFEVAYLDSQIADGSGVVIFSDVPLEAGRVFFASISYGGAVYRSDIVEIAPDTSSLALFVQLFETTTDGSGLFIERVHVLLEFPQPDLVNVIEIYIFSNLGEATVVSAGPGEPTVIFPLPEGAGSIAFDDGALGQRYLLTEDGFGDTVSIPPGTGIYQVLVYYTVPYQRNKLDFSQEMAYPVGASIVMVPAGNITIKSAGLNDMGIQDIPGGAVQVYSGPAIPRSQNLEFNISGKSASAAADPGAQSRISQTLLIVMGAVGGLLLLGGIWLFLKNRREAEFLPEDSPTASEQDEILDSILALEDLYQKGEISQKVYQKKRQELKSKLSGLTD